MNRIISKILIIVFTCIFLSPTKAFYSAFAEEITYGRIVTADCAFYADASCRIEKFYLPESYYVKIVSVKADVSRVVFMDGSTLYPMCEGYVKNVCLSFTETTPAILYPSVDLELLRDDVIFADVQKTTPIAVIEQGAPLFYYGSLTVSGEKLYYVYAKGYVGYVASSAFKEFDLQLLSDYQILPPADDSSSTDNSDSLALGEKTENGELGANEVLIIALIIIIALFAVFLILRPEKASAKNQYSSSDDD